MHHRGAGEHLHDGCTGEVVGHVTEVLGGIEDEVTRMGCAVFVGQWRHWEDREGDERADIHEVGEDQHHPSERGCAEAPELVDEHGDERDDADAYANEHRDE